MSGGTGSGKTTLLNALIALIPDDERIVAIEDTLELRIDAPNCVRFEARGLQQGAVTIRDLVKHALRHRPDHIVVGEVRGGEAADLLQALNTGHGGSLTTVHANNAESALSRLASCAMQGGGDLPWEVTCRGVVDGIALVIHMTRADGWRFVEEAAYVRGYDAGEQRMADRTTRPQATLSGVSHPAATSSSPVAVLAWLAVAPVRAQTGPAQVERVIDGDTIRVRRDGVRDTVRLTGVNTPETRPPTQGVEPYGPQAVRVHHHPPHGRRRPA